MIDPINITNFERTESELQEFLLFTIIVAGKTALIQAVKLDQFLQPARIMGLTPFEYIKFLDENNHLRIMLCDAKIGQYSRVTQAFREVAKLDLNTVQVKDLEQIPGIGPKTARFFILHSRPNQRIAVLDTHVLSWLEEQTTDILIPNSTPQSPSRYRTLENLFLEHADKLNMTPEELDLTIWRERARQPA